MSDTTQTAPAAPAPSPEPAPAKTRRSPARRLALAAIVLCAFLFAYGVVADRLTPYTSQATAQAYLVQIAPEVGGRVVAVSIDEGQVVEPGAVLFSIDPERYELAVERAEAQLEQAGQNIGASTADVAAAQAKVAQAQAELANVREQSARVFSLVKDGIYAAARGDQAKAALDSAEAAVVRAEAELESARQSLGPEGESNPQVRDALAALHLAQYDLARTTVYAPSQGGVPFLELAVGQVIGAGQPAMTYVDIQEIWIEAAFRENSLEHMDPGDPVELVLDIRPGRVFEGQVASFGYAVASRSVDPRSGLPSVKEHSGWIRDPQPMLVRITLDPEGRPFGLRLGSQANVIVYATDNALFNALGRIWIRLVSWLTYVN